MPITNQRVEKNSNQNIPELGEKKFNLGLSAVLFTALTTLSTVLAAPSFAEKNLKPENLTNNGLTSEAEKSIDGEKVAGYFDNGHSREFNSSIYKLRDTFSDCKDLDTRIKKANRGRQLIGCDRLRSAVEKLEDASKNAVNNPTNSNIQKYRNALMGTRSESTRIIQYLRDSFQNAHEKNPNDQAIFDTFASLNSTIYKRNQALSYFETLFKDGVIGYIDTGFDNIPSRFGAQRREYAQRNIALLNEITFNDTKGVLKFVESILINN